MGMMMLPVRQLYGATNDNHEDLLTLRVAVDSPTYPRAVTAASAEKACGIGETHFFLFLM